MSNFKIGEKVVCIEPNQILIKGNIYTIDGLINCTCGKLNLILKETELGHFINSVCLDCETISRNKKYCSAWRFRKLDYDFAENLLAEIKEQVSKDFILN